MRRSEIKKKGEAKGGRVRKKWMNKPTRIYQHLQSQARRFCIHAYLLMKKKWSGDTQIES